jgi:hypothetical protein
VIVCPATLIDSLRSYRVGVPAAITDAAGQSMSPPLVTVTPEPANDAADVVADPLVVLAVAPTAVAEWVAEPLDEPLAELLPELPQPASASPQFYNGRHSGTDCPDT